MKLNMGNMCPAPFCRFHGIQGCCIVAAMTQIIAMDMSRMRQTQIITDVDQGSDNLAGCQIEAADLFIQIVHIGIFFAFPRLIAARIDQFNSIGF